MDVITKDEDCVWLYDEETGTTVYADLNILKPSEFTLGVAAVATALDTVKADLIILRTDGITIDGNFVCFEYIPALASGVKVSDLPAVGHLYL